MPTLNIEQVKSALNAMNSAIPSHCERCRDVGGELCPAIQAILLKLESNSTLTMTGGISDLRGCERKNKALQIISSAL